MTDPLNDRQQDAGQPPATMRAAVLRGTRDMTLEERPVPQPAPDEVLVEVSAVGVCGSDTHYYAHGRIGRHVVEADLILGHEAAGRVVALGADVDPERLGQRISIEPQRPCRTCRWCKDGQYNLCPDMAFYATPPIDGAFAEYVTIQADFAHPVPDHVTDEAAALMEPLSVAIATCRRGGITPGSRVLVAGAGPVGIITAQTALAYGAAEVLVTDVDGARVAAAADVTGARGALAGSVEATDFACDVFVDASGVPEAVAQGLRQVLPGGRGILVGLGHASYELPVGHIQDREIWVTGVFRYAGTWPTAVDLVSRGAVDLDALVTAHFPLAQAEQALTHRVPGHLKAVVRPGR